MPTVSRSVDRVFQIMELFSTKRRPLSATEIGQALRMPNSSAFAVLSRLVALGYLDQNGASKRFFPSLRLHRICESVPEAVIGGHPLAWLADSIQNKTDETTSISRFDGLFTMPIYARCATHAQAVCVVPGITGGLATHSVVGRTLLSTLPDEEVYRFLDRASYWAKRARVSNTHEPQQVMRTITFVREHGYLCSYGLLLQGVGAISCPLPFEQAGARLAITVAGASERIEPRDGQIVDTLLRGVREFAEGLAHANPMDDEDAITPRSAPARRIDPAGTARAV